ncbi:hypothetical protein JL100_018090 [Skermanella mucosa]|uniref:hypothetical protein n=1 Tax=Skermanella mucosa TaxID=1789672 RepID=UPI00192B600A|nr:hypothetical protein [Skermanella mucosa]UEM18997.1 hypothetical protein JL100_018090 [Skermanella mucosa]
MIEPLILATRAPALETTMRALGRMITRFSAGEAHADENPVSRAHESRGYAFHTLPDSPDDWAIMQTRPIFHQPRPEEVPLDRSAPNHQDWCECDVVLKHPVHGTLVVTVREFSLIEPYPVVVEPRSGYVEAAAAASLEVWMTKVKLMFG